MSPTLASTSETSYLSSFLNTLVPTVSHAETSMSSILSSARGWATSSTGIASGVAALAIGVVGLGWWMSRSKAIANSSVSTMNLENLSAKGKEAVDAIVDEWGRSVRLAELQDTSTAAEDEEQTLTLKMDQSPIELPTDHDPSEYGDRVYMSSYKKSLISTFERYSVSRMPQLRP